MTDNMKDMTMTADTSLAVLQDDIRHMSVACAASHEAIKALLGAVGDAELRGILQHAEQGTGMAVQSLHDYLEDHGIERQDGDGNALIALSKEATDIAGTANDDPDAHDLRMANAYLRLVVYAVAGYRYYAPALMAAGDHKHMVGFSMGLVSLEDNARRMSSWVTRRASGTTGGAAG